MRYAIGVALVALVAGPTPVALAQQSSEGGPERAVVGEAAAPPGTILAPKNALELQFEAGYTQPIGQLAGDVNMSDVLHAGFVGGGALALRLSPRFAVAGYGSFHQSAPDARLGGMVFGGAGGLMGEIHALPYNLVDPFVAVGAGYRLLFVAPHGPPDNHMFHGFEVLKTDAGVDFRISKDFALGPMLGAAVDVFVWDLNETQHTNTAIANTTLSAFFFAGIAGKFDVLGKRVPEPGAAKVIPASGPPTAREVKPIASPPPS
jgi:hypothetical protein